MPSAYIAGPMRGYPQFNFPAFDQAASLGRSLGWTIISPAEMDREHGINEKGVDGKQVFTHADIREFIRRDTNILVNVLKGEEGDAIALLPEWWKSTGATGELALARWAKLAILDARTFLPMEVKFDLGSEVKVERPPLPPQFQQCGLDGSSCGEGGWSKADEAESLVRIAHDIANRKELNL